MRDAVWRAGEDAAAAWYEAAGYRIVARNWRCRLGEIDLVLERDGALVFCEVKARRGGRLAAPHEAVTGTKAARLRRLGEAFLLAHGRAAVCRFDVASVLVGPRAASVHVFHDAF